ncbi:universal stress protein [Vibrio sp. 10N.261.46.A3]|uniref:universal stress protein n=1 Tax=Vibrio sp. 10N.261.46.A3 TaxID=3229658 RepID=UPI003550FF56
MTIRTIIMPFASTANSAERLEGALSIAQYFGAHLDVLHAQISPQQLMPEERQLLPSKWLSRIDQLVSNYVAEDMNQSELEFTTLCDKLEVPLCDSDNLVMNEANKHVSAQWHNLTGYRADVVSERGKVSDLIIIPKPLNGKSSVSFDVAIEHGSRPILLMPREQKSFNPECIMIAWNGDDLGARAVKAAMPLLRKAKTIVVVTSERSLNKKPNQQDLKRYLGLHNIEVECISFKEGRIKTPQAILAHAEQFHADLIVAGALAHKKMHQQMLGGVTRRLLSKTNVPLFMVS